jgi:predicted DNA-binding protein YlxM (UPF0122 family)
MKNYVISTVVILLAAFLVLSTFAQPAETGTTADRGRGAGAGGMNTGIRSGGGRNSDTQTQQAAITAIEAQITKLKTNIEAQAATRRSITGGFEDTLTERPAGRRGGTPATYMYEVLPSQEETEKMRKLIEEHRALITSLEEQVMVLKGYQLQDEHEAEMSELQAISDSATEENAAATAKLVQNLIAKRAKAFQDIVNKLGIRLRINRRQGQGTGRQSFGTGQRFGGGQGDSDGQRRSQQ